MNGDEYDMSNTFGLTGKSDDKEYFRLSNAASDEMIHALVAAGSALAETEREKLMIVWLGDQHTYICGMGNVGFDIVEMPWTKDGFESEKAFILRCVEAAKNKLWWDRLGPELEGILKEELVIPWLESFGKLVEKMTVELVDEEERTEWLSWFGKLGKENIIREYPTCEKNKGILLSMYGCRFCVELNENGG